MRLKSKLFEGVPVDNLVGVAAAETIRVGWGSGAIIKKVNENMQYLSLRGTANIWLLIMPWMHPRSGIVVK